MKCAPQKPHVVEQTLQTWLKRCVRLRWPAWVNLGLSAICCVLPLFDVLGYEYALVTTVGTALWSPSIGLARGRRDGWQPTGLLGALTGACGALLPGLLLMLLHGLRVPPCNLVLGLLFFLLMPVGSAITGAGLGWALGALTAAARPVWAWTLVVVAQAATLAAVLARLYFEPPIVLFDPLWGFFAGSLYDEAIEVPAALWAIRATTVWATLTLWAIARANVQPRRQPSACMLAAGFVLALCLQVRLVEPACGSRIDHHAIEAVLSRTETRPGIIVHMPAGLSYAARQSLADEHAYRLEQLKARMQLPDAPTVHSYVYASAAQKASLMGGGQTMVAKPWLREVHIHSTDVPHPLLSHELAHALAAAWAHGPLHVSAQWGLLVNMGLTEGLATALAPDGLGPDVLTRARALYTMGLQVPLERLLGGARYFWQLAPARAYTQAGALLRYIEARYGMAAVRALYGNTQAQDVLGISLPQLEADFAAWLQVDTTPQPPSFAEARAQLRVPSIFAKNCPHEVARLRHRAATAPPNEAPKRWCQVLERTTSRDAKGRLVAPAQDRLAWARAAFAQGDEGSAVQTARQLAAAADIDGVTRARAKVLWAQLAARRTEEGSGGASRPAAAEEVSAWRQSCLEAIRATPWQGVDREAWLTDWALQTSEPARGALLALLTGDAQTSGQGAAAATVLFALNDAPSAHYLWGRLLLREGAYALAYPHLTEPHKHPYRPIDAERQYLAAQAAYRLGAWEQVAQHARALGPPGGVEPYWGWAQDVLHRAETELRHSPACPASAAPPPH